ncbi:MAG: PEP-utilizing enzyme [Chloroflexi bacterium]|nr:PEP-utilizing enzyme [Chloroflexota bacterium]
MYDIVPAFEFDDKADLERYEYWFLDATHSVPPWTPMFGWFWVHFCRHGMQYGAERLSLPTVKGWDWRFKNGGGYLTLYTVQSEAERAQREARFRVAIRPLVENYDKVWGGFVTEILGHYARLKATNVNTADNIELLSNFEDTVNVTRRMWEIHMYMMYGVYTAFILFENVCKDLLGIDDTKPQFQRLLRGFDNKAFQVDRELWQFARKADERGLGAAFKKPAAEVIPTLEQSDAGRKWLAEFRAFLDEDGWRMQRMAEVNLPSWVEDPTPAIANVQLYLNKGGKFNLDDERQKLAAERADAEKQVLERVPAAQRDWFKTMLSLAQRASSFSEEHNHYLDLYTHALIRRSSLALGKKLAACGTIGQADDVFFLMPDEIRKVAIAPEFHNLHPIVNARRDAWTSWQKNENPPFIGKMDMMAAIGELVKSNDPIALKVVVGAMPQPQPELNADLYGICGSSGVAEGTAKVILDEAELRNIQQGDVLVAASTAPSWTPVFSLLAGVVVDRGASLSHAAIVGREYGIPVVMNCFEGTKKIKTGQRVRVDGDRGLVFVLNNG